MAPDSEKERINSDGAKSKRPVMWRIAKWMLTLVCIAAIAIGIAISIALWTLSPARLTPIVTKYSADYVNASITTSRVELSFWSTFPTIWLEIDDLAVVSHAFDNLTPAQRLQLPQNADTLAIVKHFGGGLDIISLMAGNIKLRDVHLQSPQVNIVKYSDSLANYDIVPRHETSDTTPHIPSISINKFAIAGTSPIRYFSRTDSIDITTHIHAADINGAKAPAYKLSMSGKGAAQISSLLHIPDIAFRLDGGIKYTPADPLMLSVNDFNIAINNLNFSIDTDIRFNAPLSIHSLKMRGIAINIQEAINFIPDHYRGEFDKIETDLNVNLDVELLKRYSPETDSIPSVKVTMDIPEGSLSYENLNLRNIQGYIEVNIDGQDIDKSTIHVDDLRLFGHTVSLAVSGEVTNPVSDPKIEATLNGNINLNALPRRIWRKLPFNAKGSVTANSTVRLRIADLKPNRFHFIKANGNLHLKNLEVTTPDSSLLIYSQNAHVNLGTNRTITARELKIDSLLAVTLDIDTLHTSGKGIKITGKDIKINAATKNISASSDTTRINPLGGGIKASMLYLRSDSDSVSIRLRNPAIRASLLRYNSDASIPQLTLNMEYDRAIYASPNFKMLLSDVNTSIEMHPLQRPDMNKNMAACFDSIRSEHPALRPDSIYRLAQKAIALKRATLRDSSARSGRQRRSQRENIRFGLDNSLRSYLMWWNATGSVQSKTARIFTPHFPIRNTINDFNLDFSTDSVIITDTKIRLGKSDLFVNGKISNLAKALTSRRGDPLQIDFDIKSDTIDVNEITKAAMRGSAYARISHHTDSFHTSESDDEEKMQLAITQQTDTTKSSAFIVPSNISANLNLYADNVLYADIWFQRISGLIGIQDGAINLNHLRGYTPIGSINLTALYSAPEINDIRFAAGLIIRQLHIHQFLSMLPEIDSLLPLLKEVQGIITAEAAMTSELDSMMNLKFHTINMALKLNGDSLVLLDSENFRKISKWLRFKHKKRNMIDHMSTEIMIRDSKLDVFPFVFDVDRYRFGVSGSNDLNLNFNYHIAVLKSPLPFKFGVTIKGRPGHMRFSVGKARFNENAVTSQRQLTDTARINLIDEIEKVFKFGVRNGNKAHLHLTPHVNTDEFSVADTLTHADSVMFIKQGLIEAPPGFEMTDSLNVSATANDKKIKKRKRKK